MRPLSDKFRVCVPGRAGVQIKRYKVFEGSNLIVHAEKCPSALSGLRVRILTYLKKYAAVQTLALPIIWAIFEREHQIDYLEAPLFPSPLWGEG